MELIEYKGYKYLIANEIETKLCLGKPKDRWQILMNGKVSFSAKAGLSKDIIINFINKEIDKYIALEGYKKNFPLWEENMPAKISISSQEFKVTQHEIEWRKETRIDEFVEGIEAKQTMKPFLVLSKQFGSATFYYDPLVNDIFFDSYDYCRKIAKQDPIWVKEYLMERSRDFRASYYVEAI